MAPEYADESPAIVAKEITLAAMEKLALPQQQDRTPTNLGDAYGYLYKFIFRHVREAIIDKKYD